MPSTSASPAPLKNALCAHACACSGKPQIHGGVPGQVRDATDTANADLVEANSCAHGSTKAASNNNLPAVRTHFQKVSGSSTILLTPPHVLQRRDKEAKMLTCKRSKDALQRPSIKCYQRVSLICFPHIDIQQVERFWPPNLRDEDLKVTKHWKETLMV